MNQRCGLTIEDDAGMTVQLKIVHFYLEDTFDYLDFYDGDNEDANHIISYTDEVDPGYIFSTGSSLHINYLSDGTETYDGFHILFKSSG